MTQQECNITTYILLDHDSVGSPCSHLLSLNLYRVNVVRPSLQKLDAEIQRLELNNDPSDRFLVEDFAELFQSSVEGFIIAVQSMWERGLRNMLKLRDQKICKGVNAVAIERAHWKELQQHFHKLIGMPMDSFDSFQDLELLQSLGNAIRHGDGNAARTVYDICPTLWFNWLEPGTAIKAGSLHIAIPQDSSRHPSFESVTLTESLLEQMMLSVQWFWEDMEFIRCNSLRQKHHSVIQMLSRWPKERDERVSARRWSLKSEFKN